MLKQSLNQLEDSLWAAALAATIQKYFEEIGI